MERTVKKAVIASMEQVATEQMAYANAYQGGLVKGISCFVATVDIVLSNSLNFFILVN